MIYDTYFRSLKGTTMLGAMAGAAYAMVQFCGEHQIPQRETYIAAAVAAAVGGGLYFANPKSVGWVSPDAPTLKEEIAELVAGLTGMQAQSGPRNFSTPPIAPTQPPQTVTPPPSITLSPEEAAVLAQVLARVGGGQP